jgi:oligosaccharide repeat unit polymerase
MLLLTIITMIFLALLSYRVGGKAIFYPPVVFCGIWAFDLSLLWAGGDYFYPLIPETLAIFVIGAAMFALGSYAGSLYPLRTDSHPPAVHDSVNRIITVLVWILVISAPFYFRWILSLVAEVGGTASFLLATQVGIGEIAHQSVSFTVFATISDLSIVVAVVAFAERKGHPKRALIAIVASLLMTIMSGKTGPVGLVLALLSVDWIQNRRFRWKLVVALGLVMATAISLVEFYVHLGGGSSGSSVQENTVLVGRQVLVYAAGPMVAFDRVVRHPNVVPPVYPFYIVFLRAFKRLGFDVDIPGPGQFVRVSTDGVQHNVFTIYWSYLDVGYTGMMLVVACNGFLATLVYRRALAGHRVSLVFYTALFYAIVFSPFAEYFYTALYSMVRLCILCWLVYYFPVRWQAFKKITVPRLAPDSPKSGI